MIRRLVEKDRAQVLNFLSVEPAINLFIIGDIEAFGFEESFQSLWGQFDEMGELEGVLLKFNESFIPYFCELTKSDQLQKSDCNTTVKIAAIEDAVGSTNFS